MCKKALVVGIDEYTKCPLSGCCNDADAIRTILSKNGDNSPNFDVKCIKNIKSKGELRGLIEECFSGNNETSFFYYSGHGQVDTCGGYLVTPDYSKNDWGVSMNDILSIINKSQCRNKVVILDCCYSGEMGEIGTSSNGLTEIGEGVTILTACKKTESAIESDGKGLFTSLFVEALLGCAADLTGFITPGSVYAYIDRALGPWAQRPVFKTNITRFVPLRKIKPQVDISVIRNLSKYFPNENAEYPLDSSFEYTNSPDVPHELSEPYADPDHVKIFKELQQLEGIGLITPKDEEHMYYAAMRKKSCVLTALGRQYWNLAKNNKI